VSIGGLLGSSDPLIQGLVAGVLLNKALILQSCLGFHPAWFTRLSIKGYTRISLLKSNEITELLITTVQNDSKQNITPSDAKGLPNSSCETTTS
jgi:hypothetical protein